MFLPPLTARLGLSAARGNAVRVHRGGKYIGSVVVIGLGALVCSCHARSSPQSARASTAIRKAALSPWAVKDDIDPMTDENRPSISSTDGKGNSFFAGCDASFGVSSDLYLGDGTELTRVEYRLDKLPLKSVFAHGKGEMAILASPEKASGEELLVSWGQMMMHADLVEPHQSLAIRLRSVSGDTRTFVFDARGLSSALKDLAKHCAKRASR